ncbi:MAG: response regulator [Pyrinomonadaceae bacterium]|nr:response regulator [Pyrinomonadaceae bacterium]
MERTIEVLVIDDEPSVADALKMILEDHSYEVVVAVTGREGIEQARRQRFDVTLTDMRLPDMTGVDVINAICQENLCDSVILITAYGTPETIVTARTCGASSVLAKPFRPSDILEEISSLLIARGVSGGIHRSSPLTIECG